MLIAAHIRWVIKEKVLMESDPDEGLMKQRANSKRPKIFESSDPNSSVFFFGGGSSERHVSQRVQGSPQCLIFPCGH